MHFIETEEKKNVIYMKVIMLKGCLSAHSVTSGHLVDDHDGCVSGDSGSVEGVLIDALVSTTDESHGLDDHIGDGGVLSLELHDGVSVLVIGDGLGLLVLVLDDHVETHICLCY